MERFFHFFFPSWRFFENTGWLIRISYRWTQGSGNSLIEQPWIPLFDLETRSLRKVFWNPSGNLKHTIYDQAARLILKLSQAPVDVETLFEFCVIKNYVEDLLPPKTHYQFKILGFEKVRGEKTKKQAVILKKEGGNAIHLYHEEDLVMSKVYSKRVFQP